MNWRISLRNFSTVALFLHVKFHIEMSTNFEAVLFNKMFLTDKTSLVW